MLMFQNNKVYYPEMIYSIDFDYVKNILKGSNDIFTDYGSVIALNQKDMLLTLNNIGKIEVFYNSIDEGLLTEKVKDIENVVKKNIIDFKIKM